MNSSNPIICPVPGCTNKHISNDSTSSRDRTTHIHKHLMRYHKFSDIQCIPTNLKTQYNLNVCPHCVQQPNIYYSKPKLQDHIDNKHNNNNKRTKTITEIYKDYFPNMDTILLRNSLTYLTQWKPAPTPFRKSLYEKLPPNLKNLVSDHLYALIDIYVYLADHPIEDSTDPIENNIIHTVHLLNFLEAIICTPVNYDHNSISLTKLIKQRIETFTSGDFKKLIIDTFAVEQPKYKRKLDDAKKARLITEAANNDDLSKATKLLNTCPVAENTDEHINILRNMYPERIHTSPDPISAHTRKRRARHDHIPHNRFTRPRTSTQTNTTQDSSTSHSTTSSHAHRPLHEQNTEDHRIQNELDNLLQHDKVLLSLKFLKAGKAAGPAAESTACLKRTFSKQDPDGTYPRLPLLIRFIDIILNKRLPTEYNDFFTSSTLTALHKDLENNPHKLRPLGIGGTLRRFICSLIAHNTNFASHFLPIQWGIGIQGGMDHIIHTTQLLTEKHITRTPAEIKDNPPTRLMLLLDFKNMFNSCSRDVALAKIKTLTPHLLPFIETLYQHSTIVWVKRPNGEYEQIIQLEGFAQGCPLAPLLSALVLHELLLPLQHQLNSRAATRKRNNKPGDDGQGSLTNLLAYLDDTTAVVAYEDANFIIDYINLHGAQYGCIIQNEKTKFLTSTNGTTPFNFLPKQHQTLLTQLRNRCSNPLQAELVTGTRLLGTPIGNCEFINKFQADIIGNIEKQLSLTQVLVNDPHIQFLLLKHNIESKSAHLQSSAILTLDSINTIDNDSQFATQSNKLTKDAIKHILEQPLDKELPDHSWLVATTPLRLGGLGLRDARVESTISFFVTWLQSIRKCTKGVNKDKRVIKNAEFITLPTSLTSIFESWNTSTLKPLVHFRQVLQLLLPCLHIPKGTTNHINYIINDMPMKGLQRKIKYKIFKQSYKNIYSEAHAYKDPVISHLPAMLSKYTAIGLTHLSRSLPVNRPKPTHYRFMMCRKLRCPIPELLLQIKCSKCKKSPEIDIYGDHLMVCTSKTKAHNHFRDVLYTVAQQLCPITQDILNGKCIELEPPGIAPSHPENKPADVLIHLNNDKFTHIKKVAIDVTFVKHENFKMPTSPMMSSSTMTEQVYRHHTKFEHKKFSGQTQSRRRSDGSIADGQEVMRDLINLRHQFIPATFDSFGQLGPAITDLLHGPNTHYKPFNRKIDNLCIEATTAIEISQAKYRLSNILNRADKMWTARYGNSNWYTTSHTTKTPSAWAKHFIGVNLIELLGDHFHRGLAASQYNTSNIPTNISGTRNDYYAATSKNFTNSTPKRPKYIRHRVTNIT